MKELPKAVGQISNLPKKWQVGNLPHTPDPWSLESAFVGAGVGAAATGLRPIVELMFIGFMGVTLDQITNQAARCVTCLAARPRSRW